MTDRLYLRDEPGYTARSIEAFTVKELGETSVTTTGSSGWGGMDADTMSRLSVGKTYLLECKGFNDIAGIIDLEEGHIFRRTDQYFIDQHEAFVRDFNIRRRKDLEKHRDEYYERQFQLPEPFRDRLEAFHQNGGEEFRLEGWGYELVVCELATMYARGASEEEIDEYARKEGTSGNQHDCAKFLARNKDHPDFEKAPPALAPLGANYGVN